MYRIIGVCVTIGLLGFTVLSPAATITNHDFEADLGSTVGTNIANFTQSVSGWFEKNGTTRGDALQWDGTGNTDIPDDADGEVWAILNTSQSGHTPANSPGALYQAIGTYSDDLGVSVTLTVGQRVNLAWNDVIINLYSGNVTGADGSSLSGLGATLLDSYTIDDTVFSGPGVAEAVTLQNLLLDTGTSGVAGETLWIEFAAFNHGVDSSNQALIDDIVVSETPEASETPNIIVIMGDDIGYGDVGCNGADTNIVATPNIDRLADEGLRFTSGYCANSTCTPSRYAFMTGQYAWRESGTGIGAIDSPLKIDQDRMTIADVLKAAGYATAVIGKWHLGLGAGAPDWNGLLNPGPIELGFDYCFLLPNTNDRVPPVYVENHEVLNLDTNDPITVSTSEIPNSNPYRSVDTNTLTYASTHGHDDTVWNGVGRIGYMSGGMSARFRDEDMGDDFLARALPWIENAASNSAPFFMFFSSQDNHVPRLPHERFQGTTSLGWRTDAIAELDWGVGQILDKIAALGIETNTLVIFCSDNGPVYDDGYDDGTTVYQSSEEVDRGHDGSGIYRGGKYQVYEGGTRTPFIAWWPGRIAPGTVSDELVCSIDLAASFAALTGQTVSDTNAFPDSVNLIGALLGENGALGRDNLIQSDNQGSAFGFRQGNWKVVNTGELYNLATDPGEQTNVASLYPDRLDDMLAWRNHLMAVDSSASISLVASGGIGAVDLDWMDSTSTNFSSYSVSRGAIQGGPYTDIASNLTASAFSDTNVVGGTTNYYVVTTMYGGGIPPSESNEASAMPLAASTNLLLEAEDAVISSGAINSLGSGWSGTGYVDMDEGSYIEFLFQSSGGMYDLEIQTAGAENGMALEVTVNGGVIESALAMPNTGSWNANWERTTISNVTLTAGVNTIRYRDNGNNQPQVDRLLLIESAGETRTITWTGANSNGWFFSNGNWDVDDVVVKVAEVCTLDNRDLVIDIAGKPTYIVGGDSGINGTLDLNNNSTLTVTNNADSFRMRTDGSLVIKDGTAYFKAGNGDFDFEGTWDNMDVTVGSGIDVADGSLALINGTTVDTQWCAYNTTVLNGASTLEVRGNGNVFAWGVVNLVDTNSKVVFTGGKSVAEVVDQHLSGDAGDTSSSAAGRILVNGAGAVQGANINVFTDAGTGYTTAQYMTDPPQEYTSDGPNIIFIICDDLGYGDLGVLFQNSRTNGLPKHATPQLDTMATSGMQLHSHYCPAPVCAPSRSSLLSGVHQGHSEVRDNQFDKALANNHSLASMLNTAGYKTAAFGKWGLQGSGTAPYWEAHPLNRGFDYFYGYIRHADGHLHYPKEDGKELYEDYTEVSSDLDKCYTTDLFTGGTKRWITNHLASAEADKPMFIYLAYDTPHAKLQYPSTAYPAGGGLSGGVQWQGTAGSMINTATGTVDGYVHPDYASATYDHDGDPGTDEIAWPDIAKRWAGGVRRIDDAVGDLMVLLDDLNIATNTLVVFTSDNGVTKESYLAASFEPGFFDSFGPFDGIKRDTWEGGIRMPTLTYWPGTIASNTVSTTPSAFWDWMPTFAELAGQPAPAISDGVSLVSELTGAGSRDDSTIYVEYYQNGSTPSYDEFETAHQGRQRNQMQVVQLEGYKGIRYNIASHSDDFEIYDVINDPKETSNLATNAQFVGLQQRMKDRVLQLRRPNSTASRPYDDEVVPGASLSVSFTNGLAEYAVFEGAWPWLPDFAPMTPSATGTVAGVDLSIAPSTNQYGVLFSGYLDIQTAGDYTFYLTSDEGANLRIHDALVIDDDYLHTGAETSGSIKLAAGKHPFRLSYRHDGGSETLSFQYEGPSISKQSVPSATYALSSGSSNPVVPKGTVFVFR